jgi:hypothetical protein
LDSIDFVSQSTYPERRRRDVAAKLWAVLRRDGRTVLEREAWKLLAVSLAGRRTVDGARRVLSLGKRLARPA